MGSNQENQRSNYCSACGSYEKNTGSSESSCVWCLWTWKMAMPSWYTLRRKGFPLAYIKIIWDMYAGCKTNVMTSAGNTKEIEIEGGLHQGAALKSTVVRDHSRMKRHGQCCSRTTWSCSILLERWKQLE